MLVILDRDGVINEDSENYIRTPEEWIPIPGSLEAIAQLNRAGHQVVIATNQSGIARGYYSLATLTAIHDKMRNALAEVNAHIDGIYFCPHGPDDGCECRKPKPGLLQQIARDFNANLQEAVFIGDTLRDIQSAQCVNCPTILVLTGNGQITYEKHRPLLTHTKIAANLQEAVQLI